jgi:hypothetical protein
VIECRVKSGIRADFGEIDAMHTFPAGKDLLEPLYFLPDGSRLASARFTKKKEARNPSKSRERWGVIAKYAVIPELIVEAERVVDRQSEGIGSVPIRTFGAPISGNREFSRRRHAG